MENITKVFSDLVKPYIDTKVQNLSTVISKNGAKNYIPFPYAIESKATGYNVSDLGDGGITISGTSTIGSSLLVQKFKLPVGTYKFTCAKDSDAPIGANTSSAHYYMFIYGINGSSSWVRSDQDIATRTFTVTDANAEILLSIYVANGDTAPSTSFYPMVRLATDADPTYVPYAKTNQQLTKDTDFLVDNTEVNGAVNMLPNLRETVVDSGITYTVNADSSVTTNGTATANNHLEPVKTSDNYYLQAGTYKLTGCPSGGTDDTYYQRLYNLNDGAVQIGRDYGDGLVFTLTKSTRIGLQIQFIAGTTASNLVFKPMITVASYDGPYVPYAKSNKELTDDIVDLDERIKNVVAGTMGPPRISLTADTATEIISAAGQYILFFTGTNGKCAMAFVNVHGTDANGITVHTIFADDVTLTFDTSTAGKVFVTASAAIRLRIIKIGSTNY